MIDENIYKANVITDVLYDNVNVAGKIKLLDLKYKNDPSNSNYKKEKDRFNPVAGGLQAINGAKHAGRT